MTGSRIASAGAAASSGLHRAGAEHRLGVCRREGSAFVGLAAALFPAFRAARMHVLNAIATE